MKYAPSQDLLDFIKWAGKCGHYVIVDMFQNWLTLKEKEQ